MVYMPNIEEGRDPPKHLKMHKYASVVIRDMGDGTYRMNAPVNNCERIPSNGVWKNYFVIIQVPGEMRYVERLQKNIQTAETIGIGLVETCTAKDGFTMSLSASSIDPRVRGILNAGGWFLRPIGGSLNFRETTTKAIQDLGLKDRQFSSALGKVILSNK